MLASSSTVDRLTPLSPLQWWLLVGLVAVVVALVLAAIVCEPPESDSEDPEDDDAYDLSQPVWFGPQRPAQPARKEDAKPHVPDVSGHTWRGPM